VYISVKKKYTILVQLEKPIPCGYTCEIQCPSRILDSSLLQNVLYIKISNALDMMVSTISSIFDKAHSKV
jgi:hypothetical protein